MTLDSLDTIRCIVFGGGGFIGTNLCAALAGKVERLKIFGRRQPPIEIAHSVEWIPGDFMDSSAVAAALAGCNTVVHLITATTPLSSNIDKIADVQSNVVATLKLLEACKAEKIKRILFVSSGGAIYGIPKVIPIPETAEIKPLCAYGISKLSIEKYLALFEHLYGIEYRILRVANAYGPFQSTVRNQGAIAAFLSNALKGKSIDLWGDGSVIRDYIYIDDVVNALILAMTHQGPSEIFNIGSGVGLTLKDIIHFIEESLQKKCKINLLPERRLDVPVNILDITHAKQVLNWQPTINISEGISRTIHWMKSL